MQHPLRTVPTLRNPTTAPRQHTDETCAGAAEERRPLLLGLRGLRGLGRGDDHHIHRSSPSPSPLLLFPSVGHDHHLHRRRPRRRTLPLLLFPLFFFFFVLLLLLCCRAWMK